MFPRLNGLSSFLIIKSHTLVIRKTLRLPKLPKSDREFTLDDEIGHLDAGPDVTGP
jgi:hypothetical protein